MERDRRFGKMAPIFTSAALRGVPLAQRVCDRAAQSLATGVRLVGACFESQSIPVTCIGSVIRHPYMKTALSLELSARGNKNYFMVEPMLSASAGAALMELKLLGVPLTDQVISHLKNGPERSVCTVSFLPK
jgi:glucosamine kinase